MTDHWIPLRTLALSLAVAAFGAGPAIADPPAAGPSAEPSAEAAPAPPPRDLAAEYAACLDQVVEDAQAAFERAMAWETADGGNAARHCAARAELALGRYRRAAQRLGDLARELADIDPPLSADLAVEAVNAWVLARGPARALALLDPMIERRPGDPDLLVARAHAHAALEDFAAAIADLDRAEPLAPDRSEIPLLRAAARRQTAEYGPALADAERALALAPYDPEVFLERGNLRRLTGDLDGARADWTRVSNLAPGTPTGEAARLNLARLPRPPAAGAPDGAVAE